MIFRIDTPPIQWYSPYYGNISLVRVSDILRCRIARRRYGLYLFQNRRMEEDIFKEESYPRSQTLSVLHLSSTRNNGGKFVSQKLAEYQGLTWFSNIRFWNNFRGKRWTILFHILTFLILLFLLFNQHFDVEVTKEDRHGINFIVGEATISVVNQVKDFLMNPKLILRRQGQAIERKPQSGHHFSFHTNIRYT